MIDDLRYQRFIAHQDNVNEEIEAQDINLIENTVENIQSSVFNLGDQTFYEKALFTLENNILMNSLYIDIIESLSKIDTVKSIDYFFDTEEKSISINSINAEAVVYTKFFQNKSAATIKDVIVMAQVYKPNGTNVEFEISNDNINYYNVSLGEKYVIPTSGTGFSLRIRLNKSADSASPVVYGFAVVYRDPKYTVKLSSFTSITNDDIYKTTSHNDLTDVGPDDHHPREHAHDGQDGSGLVSHQNLTGIGEDDHHPKEHRHGQDGISKVNLQTDVIGTLGVEHLSPYLFMDSPGVTSILKNPLMEDKIVKISNPDEITYLQYDWINEGRLSKIYVLKNSTIILDEIEYLNGEFKSITKSISVASSNKINELEQYTTASK